MTNLKKKFLATDVLLLLLSVFVFLYISPSEEFRPRLIYIAPQALICAVCVFSLRFLIGVYKEYFHDVDGSMYSRVYIHLIIADLIAGTVFYFIQFLLPEAMRITFVRIVCIIVFNLMEAIISRLFYQSGFESSNENDRKIMQAVAKSGKTTEEIIAFLEK